MGNSSFFQSIINARMQQQQQQNQHDGAVQVVNTEKEEANTMPEFVTKLNVYRDELTKNLEELKNYDATPEIEQEVAAYREELVRVYAATNAAKIQKCESDIECLNTLIERESKCGG